MMRAIPTIYLFLAALSWGSCTPYSNYPGLPPVYGRVNAVSVDDIRASIRAHDTYRAAHPEERLPDDPLTFIRVLSSTKMQLHRNPHSEAVEHYSEMEKKNGRWGYQAHVIEGPDVY